LPKSKRTERPIEPEVFGAAGERLGGGLVAHHRDARITGQHAHREEDDAHRPQQHGDRDQDAARNVLEHEATSAP
jgi:hypothetical protein